MRTKCINSFRKYRPLELPMSCKVFEKGGFGVPGFKGEDAQISDIHFKIIITSEHVVGFG